MNYAVFEPTPPECVEDIKELIKDKVVYDLGAGDGAFGKVMANLYAKEVIGIESNEEILKKYIPNQENFKMAIDDFMDIDISKAEVIYCFLSSSGMYNVAMKLAKDRWKGTVISALHYLWNVPVKHKGNIADSSLGGTPSKIIYGKYLPFLIYHVDESMSEYEKTL